jgi:hypothetical protein
VEEAECQEVTVDLHCCNAMICLVALFGFVMFGFHFVPRQILQDMLADLALLLASVLVRGRRRCLVRFIAGRFVGHDDCDCDEYV